MHNGNASHGKPKTILLKSGWDTVNIGDIGHTPGTLRVLEQHIPEARLILWASLLDGPIEAMLRRRFPGLEIVQGKLDEHGEPTGEAFAQAFRRADVVIHNSSMGQDLQLMRACQKHGKAGGMFGQSYFPAFAQAQETLDVLNGTSFVFCRETLTLRTLQAAGARPPVLDFNPDGCFGIDVRDDARATAFLGERGLEDRRYITVQLRTNTQKHAHIDNFLNPAHPTPQQIADDERRAAIFRAFITAWVRETGHKVLISPEVKKEIAHNKRLLMDPLPEAIREHVVLRDTFWNADEAASVFARAHTVVCHEPHSCIIALANGTPVLHPYSAFHSPKYHMFADIGLPEWIPSLEDLSADEIYSRLQAIHDDYPAAQAKAEQAMAYVHDRFAAACASIRNAMGL